MGKSDTHRAKILGERKGWFEKNMDGNPKNSKKDYRENCGDGYHGPRWEAHHILPKESIKQSIEGAPVRPGSPTQGVSAIEVEGYADFFEDLKWITPWNLDDPHNLVGMPHLNSFMMYFDQTTLSLNPDNPKLEEQAAAIVGGYMRKRTLSFNSKKKGDRQKWKDLLDKEGSPEGYTIHQYVNWGHTEYNRLVAKELQRLWRGLTRKKDEHVASPEEMGIDPAQVAQDLRGVSDTYRKFLEKRGRNATVDNWAKGYRTDSEGAENPDYDPAWYENFTMADGWNPLTGTPG